MKAKKVIKKLNLKPNPAEGGFFAQTYVSNIKIGDKNFRGYPRTKTRSRSLCGGIYYFLEGEDVSVLHQVTGDMLYHFYSGDPVDMLLLFPPDSPKTYEICRFSNDIAAGDNPMKLIPGGTWLGSRLRPGGRFALMGVTMAPGFDEADYVIGNRNELIKKYPRQKKMITALTKLPGK